MLFRSLRLEGFRQEQSDDIGGLASFVALMVKQVQAVKMRVLPGDLQTAPWFEVLEPTWKTSVLEPFLRPDTVELDVTCLVSVVHVKTCAGGPSWRFSLSCGPT